MTRASDEADAAATAARVLIAPANIEPLVGFLESIWGVGRAGDPSFLTAIAHAGNSVLLATRDGEPVGAALGVLGWEGGIHLHSHMVAVSPHVRAAGIGFAIKLAQRAECLDNGVTEMRWTYDPLIRRNAYVNLIKLGARVRAFHPNFYGSLDDDINGTDATDRFEVSWALDAPVGGTPRETTDFALPPDYEALRRDDPDAARKFRTSSTEAFARAYDRGLTPEFSTDGYAFV